MLLRINVRSLILLCTIWISGSLAEPYTVSDITYFQKQCYFCSTVVDETNEVDTSKAPADSKFCIAVNRTLLSQDNQNITNCPHVCTVLFSRLGTAHDTVISVPPGGFRYEVIRTCMHWTRGDTTAGGSTENCTPRVSNIARSSQTISCYCETDYCNDWTYASLKRRFMEGESSLMPPLFSEESYPKSSSEYEYKLEAHLMENEDCFKCSTKFTQVDPLEQPSGFNHSACALNAREDADELHINSSYREMCQYYKDQKSIYAYRCSTELVKLYDGITFVLKRGCIRTAAVQKRFNDAPNYYQWEPRALHLDGWLYTENGCSKKVKEGATEVQNCLCDFHYCNEWSLDSLLKRFYEPRSIPMPTVNSREPSTTQLMTAAEPPTTPNPDGLPTIDPFDVRSAGNVSSTNVIHLRLDTSTVAYGVLTFLGLAYIF